MTGRRPAGFTLLELVIALAIVGALLVIAFGGLRVALAAWTQGEERAGAHQHLRGVTVVLTRALNAAYPYRAGIGPAPDPVILFRGTRDRVEFVTQAPPLPAGVPIAFTAVSIGIEVEGETPALVIRQRALPSAEPFGPAPVAFREPGITGLALEYLDEAGRAVQRWSAEERDGLPRGVRLVLTAARAGRVEPLPPITTTLRTTVLAP